MTLTAALALLSTKLSFSVPLFFFPFSSAFFCSFRRSPSASLPFLKDGAFRLFIL